MTPKSRSPRQRGVRRCRAPSPTSRSNSKSASLRRRSRRAPYLPNPPLASRHRRGHPRLLRPHSLPPLVLRLSLLAPLLPPLLPLPLLPPLASSDLRPPPMLRPPPTHDLLRPPPIPRLRDRRRQARHRRGHRSRPPPAKAFRRGHCPTAMFQHPRPGPLHRLRWRRNRRPLRRLQPSRSHRGRSHRGRLPPNRPSPSRSPPSLPSRRPPQCPRRRRFGHQLRVVPTLRGRLC